MGREISSASNPLGFVLAGPLGAELRGHAFGRCRHFFYFVFQCKVLGSYLGIAPTALVFANATHQLDTGFRSDDVAYREFDDKDPKIVDHSCASFSRTDAAHYCNLGVVEHYQRQIAVRAAGDARVQHFFEKLKVMCADTRRLPQRVNIGPDRVIDRFHYDYALEVLGGGGPLVTRGRIAGYLRGAKRQMLDYRAAKLAKGKVGIAACADAYIACYDHDADALWNQLWMAVQLECEQPGYGLDPKNYVSFL